MPAKKPPVAKGKAVPPKGKPVPPKGKGGATDKQASCPQQVQRDDRQEKRRPQQRKSNVDYMSPSQMERIWS
jgi:hypothetical protein